MFSFNKNIIFGIKPQTSSNGLSTSKNPSINESSQFHNQSIIKNNLLKHYSFKHGELDKLQTLCEILETPQKTEAQTNNDKIVAFCRINDIIQNSDRKKELVPELKFQINEKKLTFYCKNYELSSTQVLEGDHKLLEGFVGKNIAEIKQELLHKIADSYELSKAILNTNIQKVTNQTVEDKKKGLLEKYQSTEGREKIKTSIMDNKKNKLITQYRTNILNAFGIDLSKDLTKADYEQLLIDSDLVNVDGLRKVLKDANYDSYYYNSKFHILSFITKDFDLSHIEVSEEEINQEIESKINQCHQIGAEEYTQGTEKFLLENDPFCLKLKKLSDDIDQDSSIYLLTNNCDDNKIWYAQTFVTIYHFIKNQMTKVQK